MNSWVDLTGQAFASSTNTVDSDTEVGSLVSKGDIWLNVDWVPSDLDESITIDGVGSGNVWGPVTDWLVLGTPYTGFLGADSRWVDVITNNGLVSKYNWEMRIGSNLLRGSRGPVGLIWYGQSGSGCDVCWDQHGLVSGKDSLANGDISSSLVNSSDGSSSGNAKWSVWERLLHDSVLITVQAAILQRNIS